MKKGVKDETWADREIFTSKGRKIKRPWITITRIPLFSSIQPLVIEQTLQ